MKLTRLIEVMNKQGKSIRDVAENTDLDASTVWRTLNTGGCTTYTLNKICDYLHVSMDYILERDEIIEKSENYKTIREE